MTRTLVAQAEGSHLVAEPLAPGGGQREVDAGDGAAFPEAGTGAGPGRMFTRGKSLPARRKQVQEPSV